MKNSIKNNIFGASDRCHYYNGKWNKKDLAIGISSIVLGSIAKYFITLI